MSVSGDPASSFVRFRARLAKFNCESLCSVHYQLRFSAREFQYADACPHSVSHSQNVSAFSEELHHHLKALHVALLDHVLVYQHIYSNFGAFGQNVSFMTHRNLVLLPAAVTFCC